MGGTDWLGSGCLLSFPELSWLTWVIQAPVRSPVLLGPASMDVQGKGRGRYREGRAVVEATPRLPGACSEAGCAASFGSTSQTFQICCPPRATRLSVRTN